MDEEAVSKFLIEKQYNLTALELMSEIYERTGVTVSTLAAYFQDSSNFLNFDAGVAISDALGDGAGESSSEALRVKNDRIALLEHEVSVLQDQLQQAQSKSEDDRQKVTLKSPDPSMVGSAEAAEESILKVLVGKYLQSHGFKITSISFTNEAGKGKMTSDIDIPNDVELVTLLRSFLYVQNTSKATAELEKLKKEKIEDRDKIAQLGVDIDVYKRRIAELEAVIDQINSDHEKAMAESKETTSNEAKPDEPKRKDVSATGSANVIIEKPAEPPSVQLLDAVLADIEPLIAVTKRDYRHHLLSPLKTIIKNHPSKKVRMECIEKMFTFYDEPTNEERDIVVKALRECSNTQEKAEGEILPYVTQMMASQSPSTLCLVSKAVAGFADLCSMQLRSTLLFSMIRQLAEHSNPVVRAAAAADGATLVLAFGDDDDAAEKLQDLIDLGKQFVFDADGDVQSAGLCAFIPAVLRFAQLRRCVGKTMFEYWLKNTLSFGLTGSSQLAVIRFKLCSQVLETAILFLLPAEPTDEQKIVCEGEPADDSVVVAPKPEYEWIKQRLPQILPEFSPILYVQIPVKKEANRLVAKCCQAMGKQFTMSDIAPVFLKLIESGPLEHKLQHVAMFLSAVACFDQEMFYVNSRNYITYAANESHEFRQTDIQNHISFGFSLLSARDTAKRVMIMKLVEELAKSTKSAIRSAAVTIMREIMSTLEQKDIENDVLPVIVRLANDPDEALQMETVNCVGTIARFTTAQSVLRKVRDLVDEWLKGRPSVKLQVLRSLGFNAADIDSQFRNTYIIPKLLECVQLGFDWGGMEEQAYIMIVQFVNSLRDEFSDNVIKNYIIPILQILSENTALSGDPMLKELKDHFKPEKGK